MEQRHHAQRDILISQAVSRDDVRRRRRDVAMPDRHPLGPPRAPAGMQHQRDVVARRRRSRLPMRSAHNAYNSVGVHFQRVHRNAQRRRSLARRLRPFRHAQQDLGVGVFQKEGELLLAIARIQRRRRPRHGPRQETYHGRQSVRQHRRHAISAPDPHGCQIVRHSYHLLAQRIVGHADSSLWQQKCSVPGWCHLDQFEKSVGLRHKYNLKPEFAAAGIRQG